MKSSVGTIRVAACSGALSVVLGLAVTGCGSGSGGDGGGDPLPDTAPPQFVTPPVVVPNPNPSVPLAARVVFETDEPAVIELTVDDGERSFSVVPVPAFGTQHDLLLLGLRPGRTHLVTVKATDSSGNAAVASNAPSIATDPLPEVFPPFDYALGAEGCDPRAADCDLSGLEPGVILLSPRVSHPSVPGGFGLLVAIDPRIPDVVWYYQADHPIGDARRISNGNLLYVRGRQAIVEVDMQGEVVAQWWAANLLADDEIPEGAIRVAADSFHHEVLELPPGFGADFAALGSDKRHYEKYYASDTDSVPSVSGDVVGDLILTFGREDGAIDKQWSLLDVLDPHRLGYDSLGSFWNGTYGMPTRDWSHANALYFDPVDDAFLVSVRHQDAVVKIARETGELVWILGPHENWGFPWSQRLLEPIVTEGFQVEWPVIGPPRFEWPHHMHACKLTPDRTVLMFDNGNGRASPPAPELPEELRYSRAVEFRVDEEQMTVEGVWEYGGPSDPWYSRFVSDVDLLPVTGDALITDGGKFEAESGVGYARILQLRRDSLEIVLEVTIRGPDVTPPFHWSVYRSELLPSLYP